MKIQEGFLWGGATAANQCEGAYDVDGIPLLGYTCWGPHRHRVRIQRRGPGLNLKLQTLAGVPGVRAPLRRGPLRSARRVLDESAEKQQNSVRMR